MTRSESASITVSRRASTPEGSDAKHTVVWVRGEHDIATKVSLVVAIARAAGRDGADVIVDLSGVTFMDASTIGALIGSRNRLLTRSQLLEVRAPSRAARRVIELCGLADLVHQPGVAAAHPVGVAGALSTWVDVPSTHANREIERDADADAKAPSEVLQPALVRGAAAGGTVEADRGGP